MRSGGFVLVGCALASGAGLAHADELSLADPGLRLEEAWPEPPPGFNPQLDQQILDRMTDLGNRAASHLELASRDTVGLRFDMRAQRAHLRLLAGSPRYLTLRMDEDIHVADGVARVASRVDLDIHGYNLHLNLPDLEMLPASYEGTRYVELRMPLFERRW